MKTKVNSFKRSHDALLHSVPPHCSRPPLTHASTRDSWTLMAGLGRSLVWSLLLFPGSWRTQDSVCALQQSISPVMCMFWWLYGGVNGNFLQEGLCHTQVYCTQSPCSWSRPLLTRISTEDTQTLKGRSGSVSVGSLGPGVHKVCLSPPSVSGGYGV